MSETGPRKSNAVGYAMLLLGAFLILIGWSVVLGEYGSTTEVFLVMMALQVAGIVLGFLGLRIIFDPSRENAPAPPRYNELGMVCERCERPVEPGAESCPHCGNPIAWE